MNIKFKKILSISLIAGMLLTLVPLNATESFETSEAISEKKLPEDNELETQTDFEQNDLGSEEENLEDVLYLDEKLKKTISNEISIDDGWELELNLYDKVNGILKERTVSWDASNGSYLESGEKEVILQINYRNNHIQNKYNPGDLIIEIPNILYGSESEQIKYHIMTSTNTSTQNGYKFNYIGDDNFNKEEILKFSNDEEIVTNIEGSFQISYIISFDGDNGVTNHYNEMKFYPEKYEENCYHHFESSTYAILNGDYKTDDIIINLERTYNHPWKKQDFSLETKLTKCNINNEIIPNKDDYIWVGYKYKIPEQDYCSIIDEKVYNGTYPYYNTNSFEIKTEFPEGCIVLNNNYEFLSNDVSMPIYIEGNGIFASHYLYVGYPKAIYNEENNNYLIENTTQLFVNYDHIGLQKSDEENIEVNLGEFNFHYEQGEGMWIYIEEMGGRTLYSELMTAPYHKYWSINDARSSWWVMPVEAKITNKTTDITIGADKFFITGPDGEYKVLDDSEYYFQYISFPGVLYDGFNKKIPNDTYEVEFWVRERGQERYYLYDTFGNHKSEYGIETGKDEKIVSFFFKIKDVENGITTLAEDMWDNYRTPTFTLNIECADVAKQGNIIASDYMTVKDKDGNILTPNSIEYYDDFSETLLAPLDLKNHNQYLYRWSNNKEYTTIDNLKSDFELFSKKDMKINSQDKKNEKFLGVANIHFSKGYSNHSMGLFGQVISYTELINDDQKIKGFEAYDLLPYGMKLESTKEDIIKSIIGPNKNNFNLAYNNEIVYDLLPQLKEVCEIEIIENWNSTGRTWLHIKFDIGEDTMIMDPVVSNDIDYLTLSYDFSISYDAYMENSNYTNNLYLRWLKNDFFLRDEGTDDGKINIEEKDIDNNGLYNDKFSVGTSSITISSLVACQQNITKYVQTDKKNFTTDLSESSLDTNYQYKIRVNTGSTNVKDLIIYDNIEYSFGTNEYWNGEFVGIDTSYAESKNYIDKVEIYYSKKSDAGKLDEDNSWKLYSNDINKEDVKSLAFKFLDKNGNSTIFPINSMVYIIIEMKAPQKYIKNRTYNSSFSEWTPVDEFGNQIGGIVGLNSNIVGVELSKPQEVNICFNKIIDSNENTFEKIKLYKDDSYNFFITLENQETGEIIKGTVNNKNGFTINNIPIGTYIIRELDDIWFKFVNMYLNKVVEGIELKEESGRYVIIINASVEAGTTANIDIINKPNEERYYDKKYDVKNLFGI